MQSSKLRIGIISAEKSGDYLAASFIESLKSSGRDFELFGIGGKELDKFNISRPQDFDREILNVMGIIDPLKNLRQILRARKQILDFLVSKNINIFIGLDSPVVKSHGGTDYIGFSNSLDVCYRIVKGNLIEKIKQNI